MFVVRKILNVYMHGGEKYRIFMLQQVVHIVTTAISKAKNFVKLCIKFNKHILKGYRSLCNLMHDERSIYIYIYVHMYL